MLRPVGTAREVFVAFLGLGLTSFGGPVAHLGYFREAFVVRRRWLGEQAYADLVALCQFLPGPASSQVGMALGLQRAGLRGLLAAWLAFTLPSALALVAFAYGLDALSGAQDAGWIGGLKAAAVAVVAQAVWGMARAHTPDVLRLFLAAATVVAVLVWPNALVQVAAIAVAGFVGLVLLRGGGPVGRAEPFAVPIGRFAGTLCLGVFALLLIGLPLAAAVTRNGAVSLVDDFYRAGSLVFGGGHVVLPLLERATHGLVDHDVFLAGYGAAQAVPGPLFTFAAFLGAEASSWPGGLLGATLALVAIFLPSALLVVGALPFWEGLRESMRARRALMGVNAAVVGLLAAALWRPVITEGITGFATAAIALGALLALQVFKAPPWAVVAAAALAGWVLV